MPRDFDLSPYFEIVKFNVVLERRFDYERIEWADATAEGDDGVSAEAQAPGARQAGGS